MSTIPLAPRALGQHLRLSRSTPGWRSTTMDSRRPHTRLALSLSAALARCSTVRPTTSPPPSSHGLLGEDCRPAPVRRPIPHPRDPRARAPSSNVATARLGTRHLSVGPREVPASWWARRTMVRILPHARPLGQSQPITCPGSPEGQTDGRLEKEVKENSAATCRRG